MFSERSTVADEVAVILGETQYRNSEEEKKMISLNVMDRYSMRLRSEAISMSMK